MSQKSFYWCYSDFIIIQLSKTGLYHRKSPVVTSLLAPCQEYLQKDPSHFSPPAPYWSAPLLPGEWISDEDEDYTEVLQGKSPCKNQDNRALTDIRAEKKKQGYPQYKDWEDTIHPPGLLYGLPR